MTSPRYKRKNEGEVGEGGGGNFQVRGVKLWNAIPLDVRKKDIVNAFKVPL